MPRLKDKYQSEVVGSLITQFSFKNVMEVPKVDKVVVNMGVGRAGQTAAGSDAKKELDGAMSDMAAITGQKPVESLLQPSNCAKVRSSAAKSPSEATRCMSSWIG